MARSKMFKTIDLCKYENLGSSGGWNDIATVYKQQPAFKSAYIDKIRISFILEGDATAGATSEQLGYLWVVSNASTLSGTDADNTGYILSAAATRGGGGSVTLPVKRRIVDNTFEDDSGQNALRVFCRMTDTGSENYDITMVIETWGRWHQVVPS